jgi:cysteine desulfurase
LVKGDSDALLHVDAVNAVGKIAVDVDDLGADLVAISAHKFHGPKGVGALYVRKGVALEPVTAGGGQEFGMRAGTEAVHQIAGLGAAAKLAADLSPMLEVERLRDKLESYVLSAVADTSLNGAGAPRLPNTSNISFEDTNGEMILHFLDEHEIYVSSGSACNAGSGEMSAVLAAMDVPYTKAMGSIRFSLGRETTEGEIDRVMEVLPDVIERARAIGRPA